MSEKVLLSAFFNELKNIRKVLVSQDEFNASEKGGGDKELDHVLRNIVTRLEYLVNLDEVETPAYLGCLSSVEFSRLMYFLNDFLSLTSANLKNNSDAYVRLLNDFKFLLDLLVKADINTFYQVELFLNKISVRMSFLEAILNFKRNDNYFIDLEQNLSALRLDFSAYQKDVSGKLFVLNQAVDHNLKNFESRLDRFGVDLSIDLNNKVSNVSSDFEGFLSKKEEVISSMLDFYKDSLEITKDDFDLRFAEFDKSYCSVNDKIIEIEGHKENAAKIVTLLGSAALSDGYSKMSIDENKKAYYWTMGTLVLLVLAASVGLIVLYNATNQITFNLPSVITKIVAALLIAMPSIYTAREAARHRRHSDQFKKISLELAVLTPFISQMSVDKQNEIREALVCKYFVGSQGPKEDDNMPITKEISDKIIDAVSKSFDTMMSKVSK